MADKLPPSDEFDLFADEGQSDLDALVEELAQAEHIDSTEWDDVVPQGPSLPIILLSAASAIAGFIIALYVAYRELSLPIALSAGLATLFASAVLGITGALLSSITRTRAAASNIAFSCGLILLALLFFGLCLLVGAVAALILLLLAGG